MQLTERDNGGSVTVKVGEVICVELTEVATSGYQWEAETDDIVLRAKPRDDETSEPRGGARQVRLRIEALRPGRVQLRLVNRRPWEDGQPAGEFVVNVEVLEAT